MSSGAADKARRVLRADARELARTPVADPYRGALVAPEAEPVLVPQPDLRDALPGPADPLSQAQSRRSPGVVTLCGIAGLTLAACVGILGLLLIAVVSLENSINTGDRSTLAGTDAANVLLGLLDVLVAIVLAMGSIGLLTRRLSGRMALTVGCWVTAGFSLYWYRAGHAPSAVPIVLGVLALLVLLGAYHRSVTQWLGVQPAPQPR